MCADRVDGAIGSKKQILDDLGGVKYRRMLPSGIGGREVYAIRMYDTAGDLVFSLGILDAHTVDTGNFWEECTSGTLNMALYQEIVAGTHA